MLRGWSFGRILSVGLLVIAVLALLCSGVSIYALRSTIASKDRVIDIQVGRQLALEHLRLSREQREKAFRSYLLTGDEQYLREMRDRHGRLMGDAVELRDASATLDDRQLLERFQEVNADVEAAWEQVAALRRGGAPSDQVVDAFRRAGAPRINALDDALSGLSTREMRLLDEARRASASSVSSATDVVIAIAITVSICAAGLALGLRFVLARHLGAVIRDVEGSSVELATAAQDQVSNAQRLTVVTAEITTTIQELLATSRQISESAQRVTLAAEETATGATAGDDTVLRTQDAITGIKDQVDVIGSHMLDLDRKFQEIGAILDLIREFAEQTNILSINATIEAAGAGAAGRRFAVVADEIQRLADRVGGGAREIFQLIDEIREAASATMMATEEGKRSVDSGARQFHEVLMTFKQIAARSSITTEAAREIELSTKQQTSAVEQVNLAIGGVGRAARDSQESSGRTLTTSEQLAGISRRLSRIIREAQGEPAAPAPGARSDGERARRGNPGG
jgi:methyl-accepting chemotaxis protein